MGTLTGDYPAAAASLAQAVALYGRVGDRAGQAYALCQQGIMQRWTGNYAAAPPTMSRRSYWPAALMTSGPKPAPSSSLALRS